MALELPYGMQWIAEMTIAMIVLFIILLLFVSSQNTISTTINDNQVDQYRKAIVMENLLSHEASHDDLATIDGVNEESLFYNRRGYLPVDYFTQLSGSDIRYEVAPGGHCFIRNSGEPIVPLLNGVDYAYLIEPLPGIDEDSYASGAATVSDTSPCSISTVGNAAGPSGLPSDRFMSTALLRRDGDAPALPVRIYIYEVSVI